MRVALGLAVDQVERVTQAVLQDEFVEAAKHYAQTIAYHERAGEVGDIRTLVRKRERFVNAYLMLQSGE